jgi:hypothetical protein
MTTVKFRVVDRESLEEIPEYTIFVDGKEIKPGETVSLSTADWEEFSARVKANGYRVEQVYLEKELYVGRLIVGILGFFPEYGWVYGPKREQVFYLIKDKAAK